MDSEKDILKRGTKKMEKNTDKVFVELLKEAAGKAFKDLFKEHPNEHFYYCTLVLMNAQGCPVVSAMSEEALDKLLQEDVKECGYSEMESRKLLKWSFADSPYCIYGEQYFSEVEEWIANRDKNSESITLDMFMKECDMRLDSMEKVMSDLDKEGVFGSGEKRKNIVVAAEVVPPDYTNTERVLRLNSRETLKEWLEEAAESEENSF